MPQSPGKLYRNNELLWSGDFDIVIEDHDQDQSWSAIARVDDSSLRFSLLTKGARCRLELADGRSGELFPDHISTQNEDTVAFQGVGSLE